MTATISQRAAEFTSRVRAELSDLTPDVLDDLLDGLGADLEERLSDGGDLGDAALYAAEMRQAAGLPPRDPSSLTAANPRLTLSERFTTWREAKREWFDETPSRRGFRDFAISLEPAWWVLRAIIVTITALWALRHPAVNGFPLSWFALLLTAFAIIVSVQWGRGKWLPKTWLRVTYRVAHVAAIALLIPVTAAAANALWAPSISYAYAEPEPNPGLYTNGQQVTNIFAYDCEGNALDTVRLYDQDGNPLETTLADMWSDSSKMPAEQWDENLQQLLVMGFNPLAESAGAWNVYPLTGATHNDMTGELNAPEIIEPTRAELPPLARDCTAPGTDTKSHDAESTKSTDSPSVEPTEQ